MNDVQVLLFTSPTCPHCPAAKKRAQAHLRDRDDVLFSVADISTPYGRELAQSNEVMSVPTFIIKGPAYPQNIGLRGQQTEETLEKYINMAKGIKEQKKQNKAFKIGPFSIKL